MLPIVAHQLKPVQTTAPMAPTVPEIQSAMNNVPYLLKLCFQMLWKQHMGREAIVEPQFQLTTGCGRQSQAAASWEC